MTDPMEELRELLATGGFGQVAWSDTDIYAVDDATRQVVLDALLDPDADFPVIVVGGAAVCAGCVDVEAVLDAVRRRSEGTRAD